jgi:hypothetical protein
MYVDLLRRALGTDEAGPRSSDLLLADLVQSRARLRAAEGSSATSAAEALARELSYDGALIRLCASLEVPATPSGFANPPEERARLEKMLTDRGLELEPAENPEPQLV